MNKKILEKVAITLKKEPRPAMEEMAKLEAATSPQLRSYLGNFEINSADFPGEKFTPAIGQILKGKIEAKLNSIYQRENGSTEYRFDIQKITL